MHNWIFLMNALTTEQEGDGFYIAQFKNSDLAIFSYYVESNKEVFIIDPTFDTSIYTICWKKEKLHWNLFSWLTIMLIILLAILSSRFLFLWENMQRELSMGLNWHKKKMEKVWILGIFLWSLIILLDILSKVHAFNFMMPKRNQSAYSPEIQCF